LDTKAEAQRTSFETFWDCVRSGEGHPKFPKNYTTMEINERAKE
jgi:hypothetical protein